MEVDTQQSNVPKILYQTIVLYSTNKYKIFKTYYHWYFDACVKITRGLNILHTHLVIYTKLFYNSKVDSYILKDFF